jgi:hypothetical protein
MLLFNVTCLTMMVKDNCTSGECVYHTVCLLMLKINFMLVPVHDMRAASFMQMILLQLAGER